MARWFLAAVLGLFTALLLPNCAPLDRQLKIDALSDCMNRQCAKDPGQSRASCEAACRNEYGPR